MRNRRRRTRETDTELNITAFLNLMVVLIPFLLLNAVFAQVSVLKLNLPEQQDQTTSKDDDNSDQLILDLLIYKNRYEIVDRGSGHLKTIDNKDGSHDRASLNQYLKKVKKEFPDTDKVTLLLEPDTHYEQLVHAMDTARFYTTTINGQQIKKELFPEVGIGTAPPDSSDQDGESSDQTSGGRS